MVVADNLLHNGSYGTTLVLYSENRATTLGIVQALQGLENTLR